MQTPIIVYNHTEYKDLPSELYTKEKYRLQVELLKMQEWTIKEKKKVAIVLEGRDAAGKGSTIKRFIQHMMPKITRVVELGVPTSKQNRNWFNTYNKHLPRDGEIAFFDRSWYSRAVIQPTMGYCSKNQYYYFINNVNDWEKKLIDDGLILFKFYLSVSQETQQYRFFLRQSSELKYWKVSDNDLKAMEHWHLYTHYKEQMFEQTSTEHAPWILINSDNKMIARLNTMRYVLKRTNYSGKKKVKAKRYFKELEDFQITIKGVKFENLTKEQYELLFKIKAHE
jgi:polyphosphate kinase 2